MTKFSKKDLAYSVVTGLISGLIFWGILVYLGKPPFFGIPHYWLVIIVPILWIIGVNFGYFLGRWIDFFNQFGKFTAVGFTNFAVDLGILTLLLSFFAVTNGGLYVVSKSIAVFIAIIHSYVWNKFWVFDAGKSGQNGKQFGKFFIAGVVSFIINVSTASVIVNYVHPMLGLDDKTWALLGSVAGSAVALIFNFIALKLAVFNKPANTNVTNSLSQIPPENL